MESIQSLLYKLLLRLISSKNKIRKEFERGKFDGSGCPEPPAYFNSKFIVEKERVNLRNFFTVKPQKESSKQTILYLHGGAYIHNMTKQHWQFINNLIDRTGCTVVIPDYPLAPKYIYRDSFAMVMYIYKNLLRTVNSESLILMGDSAGGGFALALAQRLRIENIAQPSQIILLSPWLDASLTNPEIKYIEKNDPFLNTEGLLMAACAYVRDGNLMHQWVSPIYGSFRKLGKISLFTGTHDILFADARKFKNMADDMGIKINYFEYPKMIHVWMLLNMPEAKRAFNQIIELIKNPV